MTRYSSVAKSREAAHTSHHTTEGWINNSLFVVVLQILRGIIAEESFDRAECSANPLFELEAGITPCFFMRMSHAQTVNP